MSPPDSIAPVAAVTIYHNPLCSTSRNTLGLIRNSGVEPEIIEYLKTPPSRARLLELIAAMGISVRELLRRNGTPYDELQLDDPHWTADELVDFMLAHPLLMNRPIVVTPIGALLCRPSERSSTFFLAGNAASFAKKMVGSSSTLKAGG